MLRVLRYPRLSLLSCLLTLVCAAARDQCVSRALLGWADVLLVMTLALVVLSCVLLSCRFFVNEHGVGVGFLLRSFSAPWEELSALGVLCCNGRRAYLYGLYRASPDFLKLLHRAPRCGPWGFVVPLSRKLTDALSRLCPYEIDFSPLPNVKRPKGLRAQWQQAALYALALGPGAAVAFLTGALMLLDASVQTAHVSRAGLTLGAMGLFAAGLFLFYRLVMSALTCPGISEAGVCAGRLLYLPWDQVRFGYVHRIARLSGLFLLSCPLSDAGRMGGPPVVCFSMPETSTLVLAYLTYCPHAPHEAHEGWRGEHR